MGILKKIFRKRTKEKDPVTGVKKVTVTDHRGTVRKTKVKDKKNQITTKERYNRAGQLTKRKAKGKYIKRFKAKTSDPNFDQSVFARNQQMAGKVSTNPILNQKRNDMLNTGTDTQKVIQKDQTKGDNTQKNNTKPPSVTKTEGEKVVVPVKKKETSFSDAFKEARKKNIEKGIAHVGDSEGYFDWKGKSYNTELKEEKAARLKPKAEEIIVDKNNAATSLNVNTVDKSNVNNSSSADPITGVHSFVEDENPNKKSKGGSYKSYRSGGSTGRGPNGVL